MKIIKKLKKLLPFLLIACSFTLFAACSPTEEDKKDGQNNSNQDGQNQPDDKDQNPSESSGGMVVIPSRINIDVDDGSLELPYKIIDGNGPVEWKSEYSSVAVVDKNGKLYPVTEGTTTVTAKTSTYVTAFEVNVTDIYGTYTKISTAEEFEDLAATKAYTKSRSKFCLTNDIDFGGRTIQPLGSWANEADSFKGIFDGRGYALKNFKIANPDSCKVVDETTGTVAYFGVSLFPFVTSGTIRNLSIVNADMEGTGFTGGIAGQLESGLIEDCYINGTVTATDGFDKSIPAGGICGIMGAKAVVKNVFLNADVFGGFVFAGFNFGAGSNCVVRQDAITALKNGEKLLLCTDDTGKEGEAGKAENEQLKVFDGATCVILKDAQLTSLKNYPFTANSNWAAMSGYNAFIARADGAAPDWAKSTVS